MITNNFYNVFATMLSGKTRYSAMKTVGGSMQNIDLTTNSYYFHLFDPFHYAEVVTSSSGKGTVFGTGTTPPTKDDYWISGDMITTVSIVALQLSSGYSNGNISLTRSMTVSNTGSTTITIGEIGSVAQQRYGNILINRDVLDSPLTLAPGEQGVITYTLNMPIPQ